MQNIMMMMIIIIIIIIFKKKKRVREHTNSNKRKPQIHTWTHINPSTHTLFFNKTATKKKQETLW